MSKAKKGSKADVAAKVEPQVKAQVRTVDEADVDVAGYREVMAHAMRCVAAIRRIAPERTYEADRTVLGEYVDDLLQLECYCTEAMDNAMRAVAYTGDAAALERTMQARAVGAPEAGDSPSGLGQWVRPGMRVHAIVGGNNFEGPVLSVTEHGVFFRVVNGGDDNNDRGDILGASWANIDVPGDQPGVSSPAPVTAQAASGYTAARAHIMLAVAELSAIKCGEGEGANRHAKAIENLLDAECDCRAACENRLETLARSGDVEAVRRALAEQPAAAPMMDSGGVVYVRPGMHVEAPDGAHGDTIWGTVVAVAQGGALIRCDQGTEINSEDLSGKLTGCDLRYIRILATQEQTAAV